MLARGDITFPFYLHFNSAYYCEGITKVSHQHFIVKGTHPEATEEEGYIVCQISQVSPSAVTQPRTQFHLY